MFWFLLNSLFYEFLKLIFFRVMGEILMVVVGDNGWCYLSGVFGFGGGLKKDMLEV